MTETFSAGSELIQGSRLLVVDDEPDIRSGLAYILSLEGYRAEEAGSGADALKLLEYTSFDLMLLDMQMPGMQGVEVMARAREMCPDMSIIILTGHATLESAISAVRLKAVNYLLKPVGAGALVDAIANALHERAEKLRQRQLVQAAVNTLHKFDAQPNLAVSSSSQLVRVQPLTLDLQKWTVINDDVPDQIHELTETEALLLACLMRRPNQVLSCRELAQVAWERDLDEVQAQKLVRPYIFRLRNKIETSSKHPDLIRTVRKRGYLFVAWPE